jgi:hypothetical protein
VVATGTPESLEKQGESPTGRWLKKARRGVEIPSKVV